MHVMLWIFRYGEQRPYLRVTLGLYASTRGPDLVVPTSTREAAYGWYKSPYVVSCILSFIIPALLLSFPPPHCRHFMLPIRYFSSSCALVFLHPYFFFLCTSSPPLPQKILSHLTLQSFSTCISLFGMPTLMCGYMPTFNIITEEIFFSLFS